jgi:hypothetical protein
MMRKRYTQYVQTVQGKKRKRIKGQGNPAQILVLVVGCLRAERVDKGLFIDKDGATGSNRHRIEFSAFPTITQITGYLEVIGQTGQHPTKSHLTQLQIPNLVTEEQHLIFLKQLQCLNQSLNQYPRPKTLAPNGPPKSAP